MNSKNSSDQNISINVNLSLKDETLLMLIEMAEDMGASLEDVISSIAEDSVIDLKRLHNSFLISAGMTWFFWMGQLPKKDIFDKMYIN